MVSTAAKLCLPGGMAVALCLFPAREATAQLDSAIQVRSLSSGEAESGKPVRMKGVVIFADPPATVFIQDETAGTFFRLDGEEAPAPGDLVELTGRTFPGLFLPGIEEVSFEITGHPGLPEPIPSNYEDLLSGRFHYQYVVVEGIIRSVSPEEEGASLARLALGSRTMDIRIEQSLPAEDHLVDARVRVRGLAAGRINDRRQLVEPYLRCQSWNAIEVLQGGLPASEAPLVTSGELMTFRVAGRAQNRVRLRGELLAVFPNREMFLRQETSAVSVRLAGSAGQIAPGSMVEVAGFPEMDRFRATLGDAVVLAAEESGEPPLPIPTTADELFAGSYESDLVRIRGTIVDWYRGQTGFVITVRENERTFPVHVPALPASLDRNAVAEITGICRVEETRGEQYRSHPKSVSLRLRSLNDISLLKAPPWWTPERLATALFILLLTILVGALWITLLRRQVAQQTKALRNRIEKEAVLEERQRIAREFHDTLEQDLVGLTLRLDAATSRGIDDKTQGFLEGSRRLVTRIQLEARNLLFDLHDAHGATSDLRESLEAVAEELPPEVGPELTIEVNEIAPVSSRAAHHLKMIAREAVTNALKHAGASRISVQCGQAGREIVLTVSDDGCGLRDETATSGRSGHFGCMGIRERARRIGATVEWKSTREAGTILETRLPLDQDATPT